MTPETRSLIKNYAVILFILLIPLGWLMLVTGGGILFPFGGFDREFIDLGGVEAQQKLGSWPHDVEVSDVKKLSFKTTSAIDCHSAWYRIEGTDDAIKRWVEDAHNECAESLRATSRDHKKIEGIARELSGIPSAYDSTQHPPNWWNPPAGSCRVTEIMIWSSASVGQGTYTIVDPTANVLWIYEFSAQHHTLWQPGNLPVDSTVLEAVD